MIKLSQAIDALYSVNAETSCYFDVNTNEILWQFYFDEENSTYTDNDEFNDNIISMFNFYSKNDYDIMHEFISGLSDELLKKELYNVTRGKGAFQRFRKIIDYYNITDDWYKFQNNEYKKITVNWCLDNKIEYEDDLKK